MIFSHDVALSSCAVTSFTAEDLIVTGSSVFEVIPVQHTNDFFVWLAVTPGTGSFSVVIKSGTYIHVLLSCQNSRGDTNALNPYNRINSYIDAKVQ